jgi:hypothetical protein
MIEIPESSMVPSSEKVQELLMVKVPWSEKVQIWLGMIEIPGNKRSLLESPPHPPPSSPLPYTGVPVSVSKTAKSYNVSHEVPVLL